MSSAIFLVSNKFVALGKTVRIVISRLYRCIGNLHIEDPLYNNSLVVLLLASSVKLSGGFHGS